MNLIGPPASGSEALVLRSTRIFQPFGACARSGVTMRAASTATRTRRLSMDAILQRGRRPGNRLIPLSITCPSRGKSGQASPRTRRPIRRAGMISHHTDMAKKKVALTLDAALVERVDELVARRRFRSRSQAIEMALADKLRRLARTRLARESAKLNPREEKRLADEGLLEDFGSWPEY